MYPIRLEDAFPSEHNHLLYTDEQWTLVETFLDRVSQLRNNLHLLESYVEDVRIKHSQLLLTPGSHPRWCQLYYIWYCTYLGLTDELNQAMDAFKVLSNAARLEINRKFT